MSGEYLQDTDHSLLCKELKKVSDWFTLGLYFGIPVSELKRIEADHPSVRRRKQEVCATFIRSNTSASWDLVIYALNEMNEKRLARKIEKKYRAKQNSAKLPSQICARESSSSSSLLSENSSIGTSFSGSEPMDSYDFSPSYRCGCRNCSIFKICDDGCPNPDKHAVLPVLNETTSVATSLHHFHLEAQRQRETKQMMTSFASFVGETCESMKKKVTVEKFAVWLKQLEAFDKVSHCSESTSALLAQQIDEISQAGSMERVFLILSDYWSWYNHYLVEEIVNKFGDQDDRRRLDDFKENFSMFAQNRIGEFSQHEMSLGAAGGDEKRRPPLLFKVDKIWDNICINQLPDIHQNLASILGVNPHTLYFASIRRGCILMEFLIPSSVAQAVFPLSLSQKEALASASVIKVHCGTHSYNFLSSSTPQVYNLSNGFVPYPIPHNTPSVSILGSQTSLRQPFNRRSCARSESKYDWKLSEERERASQISAQSAGNLSADVSRMSPAPITMMMPPGSPNHLPPKTTAICKSSQQNLGSSEHPHWHLHTKSYIRHTQRPPLLRRRSKSVDLTPIIEIRETPVIEKRLTPTPIDENRVLRRASLKLQADCDSPDGPEEDPNWTPPLLREISLSADNLPALCLNDCPFTPSPLRENRTLVAAAMSPLREQQSHWVHKPNLGTLAESSLEYHDYEHRDAELGSLRPGSEVSAHFFQPSDVSDQEGIYNSSRGSFISVPGSHANLQQPSNRGSYAESESEFYQKLFPNKDGRESRASQISTQSTGHLSADVSQISYAPTCTTMMMPPGSPNHLPPKTIAIPESASPAPLPDEILRHVVGCLMHRQDCQIPHCPCKDVQQRYRELLIKDATAAQEPLKLLPCDSKKQHLHLSLSQQNLVANEHPHSHLHTKSLICDTQRPSLLMQRSKLPDLTPIMEIREMSLSADNFPALCFNDCPLTPSPLRENRTLVAAAMSPLMEQPSRWVHKPKLRILAENSLSAESSSDYYSSISSRSVSAASTENKKITKEKTQVEENPSTPMQLCTSTLGSESGYVTNFSDTEGNSSKLSLLADDEINRIRKVADWLMHTQGNSDKLSLLTDDEVIPGSHTESESEFYQKLFPNKDGRESKASTQSVGNVSAAVSRMSPAPNTMMMPPGSPNYPPKTTAIPESASPAPLSNDILRCVVGCLMHRQDCQIPHCPCKDVQQRYHELLIKDTTAAQQPPNPPPCDSKKHHLHLSLSQQNLGANEHPHWHLHTKSHIRHTQNKPLLRQRSKSVDLTPIIEIRETPVIEKRLTPTPIDENRVLRRASFKLQADCDSPDGPEEDPNWTPPLLREISLSADNLPALCLNDCPLSPSPLRENPTLVAAAMSPLREQRSRWVHKPNFGTLAESSLSIESSSEDGSNTSSRSVSTASMENEGITKEKPQVPPSIPAAKPLRTSTFIPESGYDTYYSDSTDTEANSSKLSGKHNTLIRHDPAHLQKYSLTHSLGHSPTHPSTQRSPTHRYQTSSTGHNAKGHSPLRLPEAVVTETLC